MIQGKQTVWLRPYSIIQHIYFHNKGLCDCIVQGLEDRLCSKNMVSSQRQKAMGKNAGFGSIKHILLI